MRILIILLFIPLLATAQRVNFTPKRITGTIIKVHDGDSYHLCVGKASPGSAGAICQGRVIRVRLHAADCPELRQPYGPQAQAYVSSLLLGKTITIDSLYHDRNHRVLAIVYTPAGANLNQLLLSRGLAWADPRYSKDTTYLHLQHQAQRRRIGLWQQQSTTSPRTYRHDH